VEFGPGPEGGVSVRLEIPLRRATAAEPERVAP
jgi:hypothetical protein